MANRWSNQFFASMNKGMISIYAQVAIGASGAPTLSAANSKGVVSVTRNSAGIYTFVFGTTASSLDTYYHFCLAEARFIVASGVPASPGMNIVTDNSATVGTASIKLQFFTGGSATDPDSGSTMLVRFDFQNSSAF